MYMDKFDMERCGHDDVKHGFIIYFPDVCPTFSIQELEEKVKEMIQNDSFAKANLAISKGGLQKVTGESASETSGKVTISWSAPTATNFTDEALLVAVMVQEDTGIVEVKTAAADALSLESSVTFGAGDVDIYVYYLDKRGSNKIASASDYLTVTVA